MSISAYPLHWPEGWKRTPNYKRVTAKFGTRKTPGGYSSIDHINVADAVNRVQDALALMGVRHENIVISCNEDPRTRSLNRAAHNNFPQDPGAAVWWQHNGLRQCIAIDRYTRPADNLAAIAATLEAMRAIERHGGAEIQERAFTGLTPIAAPEASLQVKQRPWRDVLGLTSFERSLQAVEDAYRRLASQWHPDNHQQDAQAAHHKMAELNAAHEAARKELGS